MNKTILAIGVATVFTAGAAIYAYQATNNSGIADPNDAKQVALGKAIYAESCASCHGENLEGETPDWKSQKEDGTLPAPPHDGTGHTWHHGDQLLFSYTKEGGQANVPDGFTSGMPAFKNLHTDEEIWAVLSYIKTSWSDKQRYSQQLISEQEKK